MTIKRIWKNLDEYYGDSAVEEVRRNEFDPTIAAAITDVREAQGLPSPEPHHAHGEDHGGDHAVADHQPLALAAVGAVNDPTASTDGEELRRNLPALSRRGFLQLTGAATVFGMVGCWHKPPHTLVPYKDHPEGHVLGKANYFSTTIRPQGRALPILAKTYDFRPIKLEGNYDAPWTRGTLDLAGQAALLDLYDPDRVYSRNGRLIEGPLKNDGNGTFSSASWGALDNAVGQRLKDGQVALITPPLDGVATTTFISALSAACGGRLRHVAYDPFALDGTRQVRGRCFGSDAAHNPIYHLERAEVIVTLGSDLLGGAEMGLAETVAYGDQRRLKNPGHQAEMGSFIAFEAAMSQGGTCADLRIRAAQEDLASIGWAIAVRVADALGKNDHLPAWAAEEARRGEASVEPHPTLLQNAQWGDQDHPHRGSGIAYAAEQLLAAQRAGKHSLIYAGGALNQGSEAYPLLAVANVLNALLGNEGVTVETTTVAESSLPANLAAVLEVLDAAAAGEIDTLILVDSNPVFALGERAAAGLRALAAKGGLIACNDRVDESAALANWLAPITHDLESWGDAEPYAGHHCLQQPVIVPLWDVRQWQESVMSFCIAAGIGSASFRTEIPEQLIERYSAAQRTFLWTAENNGVRPWRDWVLDVWGNQVRQRVGAGARAEAFVRAAQVRGFVLEPKAATAAAPSLNLAAVAELRPAPAHAGYTLLISPSRTLRDGRSANNAWLQETPDPVSKVTWDTWVSVGVSDARDLMVRDNSVLEIAVNGQTVKLPVMVQPGQQRGHLEVFCGFGRTQAGAVAAGGGVDGIQVNAFTLAAPQQRWVHPDAVQVTRDHYRLASTQGHQYMDGRPIAHDDVLALHKQDPAVNRHYPHVSWEGSTSPADDPTHSGHNLSLFNSSIIYPGRRWGMAIDMNACTGCNACVVACSAENNVPVVGRDEVRLGREMHWIRIDRYYTISSLSYSDLKYKGKKESREILEDPQDVEVLHQPMMCQQCGHAPCEEVCPAMATMHNDEGLNVQIYNRCIGTRYCANNCPYKVRRFNYYEYSKYRFGPQGSGNPLGRVVRNIVREGATSSQEEMTTLPLNLMLNPSITLRSKGVMEKCNFCLQRTRDIREQEKRDNRKYDDRAPGAVTTACAQTCPTNAITFGDINDPDSAVSQVSANNPQGYRVLDARVNTRPSVNYLRKVRNRPPTAEEESYVTKILSKKSAANDGSDTHQEGVN